MNKKLLESISIDIANVLALRSVKKDENQACNCFYFLSELPEAAKPFKKH